MSKPANTRIRMRVNTKSDKCDLCNRPRNKVLDLFDLNVNNQIITICDLCNEELFRRSLSATCYVNRRLKDKHDMKIIQARNRLKYWTNTLI